MKVHYTLVGFAAAFVIPVCILLHLKPGFFEIEASLTKEKATISQDSNVDRALQAAQEMDKSQLQNEFFSFQRLSALKDPYQRISDDFNIPTLLYRRVEFWFDIYTHHDSKTYVLHHTKYPWLIYEVIKTHRFYKGAGAYWWKKQRAERYVRKRKNLYKTALRNLSRRREHRPRNQVESFVAQLLSERRYKKSVLYKEASSNIRTQLGQKDFFLSGLENSQKYLGIFEKEFEKQGLPKELTRLPFVESSFNEKAQSKVGATGVWQIMPNIGKKFSIVGKYIDERNSPVKAAQMAARLLKENYRGLKGWPLAVTAYNNGMGNLLRAIRRAKTRDLARIIARNYKGAFKFASSNFYASYLAALYAEKYHREIFKNTVITKEPQLIKVPIRLTRSLKPMVLAKWAGITMDELLELNLDIKRAVKNNKRLPRGFRVFLAPKNHKKLSQRLNSKS